MLWNVLSLFVYFVSLCLHVTIPTLDRLLLGIFKILSEACTVVASFGCSLSTLHVVSCVPYFNSEFNSGFLKQMLYRYHKLRSYTCLTYPDNYISVIQAVICQVANRTASTEFNCCTQTAVHAWWWACLMAQIVGLKIHTSVVRSVIRKVAIPGLAVAIEPPGEQSADNKLCF